MKPNLQHQLQMIWRTENPKYIILVKNKAGADMDFSKFKTVEEDRKKEPKVKVNPRYILTIATNFGGVLIVKVEDTFEKTIPLRIETVEDKKDYWIKRTKKEYKPLRYDA